MPLLGMERALLPEFAKDKDQWPDDQLPEVQTWQKAWNPTGIKKPPHTDFVEEPTVADTKDDHRVPAAGLLALSPIIERCIQHRGTRTVLDISR
jgi:hypothetical protein